VAGGLTELTLAVGHRGGLVEDNFLRPVSAKSPKLSPRPSSSPSVTPTPSPVATPSVTPPPTASTVTTNAFVHMRAAKSTSSAILYNLDGGTVLQLLPDSDAQWQEVGYNGAVGYVFKTYLSY
jgi:hypothetical protein